MKILIVDDAAFLRMTLKHILTQLGHNIIGEACDGYDAIKSYKELKPDLVTLDITMPHMDGLEALRGILEYDKNANVIMCSAMGRNDFVMDALKVGAKGFIVKPFVEDDIIKEISRISRIS